MHTRAPGKHASHPNEFWLGLLLATGNDQLYSLCGFSARKLFAEDLV